MALKAGYHGIKEVWALQLKKLASSITIGGEDQATVEDALDALATEVSGKVDSDTLHDFTQISVDITDFVGKWKIVDGICFGIVNYTKKGSSYTVARIPNVKIYNDLTNFVIGVGASTKNVVLVSSGTDLVLQEQITTDQTNKTTLSFCFPINPPAAASALSSTPDDNREVIPEISQDPEPVTNTTRSTKKKTATNKEGE